MKTHNPRPDWRGGGDSTKWRDPATVVATRQAAPAVTAPGAMRIRQWRPLRRNSLVGFADISLCLTSSAWLEIDGCSVLAGKDGYWAALPSKPLIDKDGNAVRDPKNGRVQYVPLLNWSDKTVARRWSDALVRLLQTQYPDALASEPAGGDDSR
jgi:hypothetical protein